jgi:hypothetical protein
LHIDQLPAQYLGYFLLGLAALGLCRVNIWYGGPIDPRFDPEVVNPPEQQTLEDDDPSAT